MALFLLRSRFASVVHHHYRSWFSLTTPELKTSRVTSVMRHQYRFSSASGFLSTMMKTPTIKDASNYLNRKVEERNEKHRTVQQLAINVNLLNLSCESTAEGGVCDVYVVGFSSFSSIASIRAAKAIMSYLKPQVLYLPFGYKPLLSKPRKSSPTNLIKAFMNKSIDDFRSLSIVGFLAKLMPEVQHVAYREALKYGSNVVLGDRPEEITERSWEMMPTCIQLDDIYLFYGISTYEQDKLARLFAHQLLEVARKNSSVVAIVPCPRDASRSFDNLGRMNEYWKQLIEKYSPTNLVKAFVNKSIDDFRSLSIVGFLAKLLPRVQHVAYREALKYGSNVVLGDRLEEITEESWEMMPTCIQLDDIYLFYGISTYEQDKLARLFAHQLLEVARKNSSVVAIVPCPSNASRSFDNLGRMNEYWKQLIEL